MLEKWLPHLSAACVHISKNEHDENQTDEPEGNASGFPPILEKVATGEKRVSLWTGISSSNIPPMWWTPANTHDFLENLVLKSEDIEAWRREINTLPGVTQFMGNDDVSMFSGTGKFVSPSKCLFFLVNKDLPSVFITWLCLRSFVFVSVYMGGRLRF